MEPTRWYHAETSRVVPMLGRRSKSQLLDDGKTEERKMKNKTWMVKLALVSFAMLLLAPPVYADCARKGGHHADMSRMFFKKAKMVLAHHEQIGLSDEQVETIRALKLEIKKAVILQKAEIEVVGLDVKAALREEKVDVKRLNMLIDSKYTAKAAKAKTVIGAYAKLKAQLTSDQWEQLWELKKAGKNKPAEGWHGKTGY